METPTRPAETKEELAEDIKKAAANTRDRVRAEADRAIDEARDQARAYAAERRDGTVSYVSDVADALDRAIDVLDERGRTSTAHYARMAANELHGLGNRVEDQDVGSWVDEVESVARRRPLLFFGGAFLIGFAATRLLLPESERDAGRQRVEDNGYDSPDGPASNAGDV